jgi:uncharacterized membrane protein
MVRASDGRAAPRLAGAGIVGIAVAVVVGATLGWGYSAVCGWIAAALVYLVALWSVVRPMDAEQTASHATREDPTRDISRIVVLLASLASLGGVAYLLVDTSSSSNETTAAAAALGVGSVVASWIVVHSLYMVRYAHLYYSAPVGGIDFNQDDPPCYADFAYLAFTLGMTYQVSDTNLRDRAIRGTVLQHALVSFLYGAVILGSTVNLVVGLASASR